MAAKKPAVPTTAAPQTSEAETERTAPMGFQRDAAVSDAPWFIFEEENVIHGALIGIYEMQTDPPRTYAQVELWEPCPVRVGRGEDAEEVMAAVGQAAARIASVGESFARQTRDLGVAMDAAERRIAEAERLMAREAETLDAAATKVVREASDATDAFRRQADDLAAAAASANDAQGRLTASEFEAKRGRFLRASRLVVEGLNSLSIDLARTLDPSVTDRVLKEFLGGDRGVFVRRLLRLNWGATGRVVQKRYGEDPEFRRYVNDYLTQYDRLIADAREADPENVLVSTFLSADVGKLYMTLASIVGWKK